jgi:hypothetical protein
MTSGSDGSPATSAGGPSATEQARAIAKEAYIYGFPMVDTYRVQYSYFVDTGNPEYKGAWNQVHSTARVFTLAGTAIQTPNSDTPIRCWVPTCAPSRWCWVSRRSSLGGTTRCSS